MSVKVGVAQFSSVDDVDSNVARIESSIADAAEQGIQLIAFHELATTDYFCFESRNTERFKLAEPIPGPSTERVAKVADKYDMHVIFPLYEQVGDARYNTAAYIEPGRGVVGTYRKTHVPASRAREHERGAEENFYFSPSDKGFEVWDSPLGIRIGVLICYDRHHAEGQRTYGLLDTDLLVVPTASYRKFIIEVLWEAELVSAAFQNSYYIAGINKVGPVVGIDGEQRSYPGRSLIIDPEGVVLARADDQEGIVSAEIDPGKPKQVREVLRFFEYRRPDLYGKLTEPVRAG